MLEYPPALLWSPVRRWRGERNTVRVCGVWIMRPELGNGRMFRPGVLVSDSGEVLPYLTLPRTRAWNRGDVDFGDLQEPEGPPQFGVSLPFPIKRAMPAEAFTADLQEWPHSQIPTDDDWQRAAATHLRQVL
ncbi:hypothetical protein [Nocardiopsis sp. MG754419]|uniref:hypothetical protein n=1 Tax=Nocardiopsis sp. MG754419 TaxID=2259865 RepID=UPI001BA4568F|nr:hypothetical protein [Nocardiopsis sp. MG754419]